MDQGLTSFSSLQLKDFEAFVPSETLPEWGAGGSHLSGLCRGKERTPVARTSQQGPWPPRGYRSRDSSAYRVSQGGTQGVLAEDVLGLALWGRPLPVVVGPTERAGPIEGLWG